MKGIIMEATQKQIDFIKRLDPNYEIPDDFDVSDASKVITKLLKEEKKNKQKKKIELETPRPKTKEKAEIAPKGEDPKTYMAKAEKILKEQIAKIKQQDIKYVYEYLYGVVPKDAVLSAKYVCYNLTPEIVWSHVVEKAKEYAKGANSVGISDDKVVFGWAVDRIDEAPTIAKKEAEEKAKREQAEKEAKEKSKSKSSSKTKKATTAPKKTVKRIVINKDTGEISLFDFAE